MDSERIAGILGAIVAIVVLAAAFVYVPVSQLGKPDKPKVEQAAQPAPAAPPVRGPVVREVPQQ